MADVVHRALLVIQAEEQGAERGTVRGLAPTDHDAVGGALVLDLRPESLARYVRTVPGFRDHTVEAGALELLEPVLRGLRVAGVGREEDRRLGTLQQLLEPP